MDDDVRPFATDNRRLGAFQKGSGQITETVSSTLGGGSLVVTNRRRGQRIGGGE